MEKQRAKMTWKTLATNILLYLFSVISSCRETRMQPILFLGNVQNAKSSFGIVNGS